MERQNLFLLDGPITHAHIRYVGEEEGAKSDEPRLFDYNGALTYLKTISGSSKRIVDSNHAMLDFGDIDNLTCPTGEKLDIWTKKIIDRASRTTLERVQKIRESPSSDNIIIGAEVDIIGENGILSLDNNCLKQLDLPTASFHRFIWSIFSERKYYSSNDLIKLFDGALENPYIRILGHPARSSSKLIGQLKSTDFIPILHKMNSKRVAYEVSILDDLSSKENGITLENVILCTKIGTPLILSSDFHNFQFLDSQNPSTTLEVSNNSGNINYKLFKLLLKNIRVLREIGVRSDMVVNSSDENFDRWIHLR